MPIFRGSRYAGDSFTAIVESDGTEKRFFHLRTDTLTMDDVGDQFSVSKTKTPELKLDLLMYQKFNKPLKWWILGEINEIIDIWKTTLTDSIVIPSKEFVLKQ